MYFRIFLTLSCVSLTSLVALNAQETTSRQTQEGGTLTGSITLDNKKVTGPLTVRGSLTARNVDLQDLNVIGAATIAGGTQTTGTSAGRSVVNKKAEIRGSLTAQSTDFLSTVDVYGRLTAQDSTFKDTLTVIGEPTYVRLSNTTTQNIIIKKIQATEGQYTYSSTETRKPQVILVQAKVNGTITFADNAGEVYTDNPETVTVKNGQVIKGLPATETTRTGGTLLRDIGEKIGTALSDFFKQP